MKIFGTIMTLAGGICLGYGLADAPAWFTVTGVGFLFAFQGLRLLDYNTEKPKDKP